VRSEEREASSEDMSIETGDCVEAGLADAVLEAEESVALGST